MRFLGAAQVGWDRSALGLVLHEESNAPGNVAEK